MRFAKPGQLRRSTSSSSTRTANSGIEPDDRADAQRHRRAVVDARAGRSRSRPPRPTARCRRACSSHRRWRRSARRTSTRCPRTPDRRSPARAPSRASWRSRTPSTPCRRPARGAARRAAACERSNTPMLSSPRKPPANRLLPSASLRFTHQVKLISSFWNTRSRNTRSRCAARRRSSCRRASTPTRAPADSRRRTRTRTPAICPFGCMYHSRSSSSSCSLANCGSMRANGIMWNARSHAANHGYSHLSGIEMTSRL